MKCPLIFEDIEYLEQIHIEDTKQLDGRWRIAGESGIALIAIGAGWTMREAREAVYECIDSVLIPNMYYRDDIGERWIDQDSDKLHAWGYLGPRVQ